MPSPLIVDAPPALDAPFMQKPTEVVDTAFGLYGFLPDDQDPRWSFLARYTGAKNGIGFGRMNFANAWGATYLSETTSYRSGFVTTVNPENSLQLERALDNLVHIGDVIDRFTLSDHGYEPFDMRLSLTDRLTNDPTQPRQDVTPCPEALFQIQLHVPDGYLARVGFNLHFEDDASVMSIVNVQGTPGGVKRNAEFEATNGVNPFNLLVRRAIAVAAAEDPAYEVRGLVNPQKGNSQLYWGVFTKEGVNMTHAKRKDI